MSGVYISIGLFASSITQNQIVAFLMAMFAGIFFHLIFDLLSASVGGIVGQIFNTLSMRVHFESISRGVVDSSDIIYFLSLIFLGLFLAEISLSKRNKVN
jgi:ABC-2 type transport system permease protein